MVYQLVKITWFHWKQSRPWQSMEREKMAGQYGNVNKTIQNLTVLQINDVDDLLYVKGSVPGPKNGYLTVRDAIKSSLPENALKPAGLKDNNESKKNLSDQREIVQDAETKSKSENVEVKNEKINDQIATEQAVSSSDVSSDSVTTDADKDIIIKRFKLKVKTLNKTKSKNLTL